MIEYSPSRVPGWLSLGLVAILGTSGAAIGQQAGRAVPDAAVLSSKPLTIAPAPADGGPLFEAVPGETTGVTLRHEILPDHPLRRLYPYAWATGGVAIGDVNGDGRADLFFPGGPGPSRLYLQSGDFLFFDATESAGIVPDPAAWCSGAAMADIDNDGDLDIYVTAHGSPNRLYINEGKEGRAHFQERAKAWGVDLVDGSLNAAFADFDRDGWLDLYVQTYHLESPTGRPEGELEITIRDGIPFLRDEWQAYYVARRKPDGDYTWTEGGRPDYLLRNTGQGKFADVTGAAGLAVGRAYGSSVTWCDVDHDGLPDLYVGHDGLDPDLFYRNGGARGFAEGTRRVFSQTPWFTRGAVSADFNNDLLADLLVSNAGAGPAEAVTPPDEAHRTAMLTSGGAPQVARNALLINAGTARFLDTAWMAGLARTGATWSVKAGDFDNDGWVDAFFANGAVRDAGNRPPDSLAGANLVGKTRWDLLADAAPRREGNLAFRNRGDLNFENVSDAWGLGHVGMSYAVGSGDLDGDGDLDLVVCHAGEPVTLYRNRSTAKRLQVRLIGRASNTWGLGAEVTIAVKGRGQMRQLHPHSGSLASDEPLVHFGLGDATEVERLTVRWPSGAVETFEHLPADHRHTIVEANSMIPPVGRMRRPQPMFSATGLLGGAGLPEALAEKPAQPEWLGRLGPGLAWLDLDGDGRDEFYFPGSRGIPGRLVTQSLAMAQLKQPFGADAAAEDTAAVFFDADGDGDADLYVGSGDPEAEPGSEALRDRLYLNDGLTFTRAPADHLPDLREVTGPVAAADFDRDGDVDLFVGTRLGLGGDPLRPTSRLLVNDGKGTFTEAPADVADGLGDSGAVSAALWTDLDADCWLDLIVAAHGGRIGVWKNAAGRLTDASEAAGTATLVGGWNGLAGGDLDQDGDIDYAVTNEGLNEPAVADSSAAGDSGRVRESGLLINDGTGRLAFRPLPRVAQTAPAFGVVVSDLNVDGKADVYLVQNREHAGQSPDPAADGLSLLLIGTGDPDHPLLPVWPDDSGLVLFGQGRGVATVDLNDDDRADLVAGLNENDPAAFLNLTGDSDRQPFKVSLLEPGRIAAGARVTVACDGMAPQVAEYHAGGGFLSQSPPVLFFAAPKTAGASAKVTIRWPDGELTERTVYFD